MSLKRNPRARGTTSGTLKTREWPGLSDFRNPRRKGSPDKTWKWTFWEGRWSEFSVIRPQSGATNLSSASSRKPRGLNPSARLRLLVSGAALAKNTSGASRDSASPFCPAWMLKVQYSEPSWQSRGGVFFQAIPSRAQRHPIHFI